MKTFDKLDIATEYLDAAVSEHLDCGRHFAAYNLAAVAEELMSKILKCSGKRDSADLKLGAIQAISRSLGRPDGDRKVWRNLLFRLKNSIKHMDSRSDRYVDANIETNARQKIGDAISNLERLGLRKSALVCRFDTHRLSRARNLAAGSDVCR